MTRTAAILLAGALALAACGTGVQQRSYGGGADETAIGGQAWPYGQRDPAYRTTDPVYPWPLGQDKLDP